jgi:hypothetical protein
MLALRFSRKTLGLVAAEHRRTPRRAPLSDTSPFTIHTLLLTRAQKKTAAANSYTGRWEASVTSSEQVFLIDFTVSLESVPLSSSIAERTLCNPCNIFIMVG